MDNLGAHKGERVRELIEGRGCELLFLAPYTHRISIPSRGGVLEGEDTVLRRAGARTREALIEAMGKALDTVMTTKDTQGFFEHCGYPLPAQPL